MNVRDWIKKNRRLRGGRECVWLLLLIAAVMALLCGCTKTGAAAKAGSTGPHTESETEVLTGVLTAHFIDVGQGDSTLIESDGHFMLIDAGEREDGPLVVSYLKKQGVKRLDYVIGTHPHSDHIGGLADVMDAFSADCVMIPEKEHTTRAYERLLEGVEDQGLKVTLPVVGDVYEFGSASFQILAPNRDYEDDLNNWSMGIRITNGKNHFVFCGDAKKEAETDICSNGLELSADVLKLSHHGSYSSSSREFMDQVDPRYAVISCGRNNDYGYPHEVIKNVLAKRGIETYRTDEQGTITAISDGKNITWSYTGVPEETVSAAEKDGNPDYILNTNTRRFHLPSCQSAVEMNPYNKEEYYGSREDLLNMGYGPCQGCTP